MFGMRVPVRPDVGRQLCARRSPRGCGRSARVGTPAALSLRATGRWTDAEAIPERRP